MTPVEFITRPWSPRSRRGRLLAAVLLLLSPVALAAGFWLQARRNAHLTRYDFNREAAIAEARSIAAARGFNTSDWTVAVRPLFDHENRLHQRLRPRGRQGRQPRLAPPVQVSVTLVRSDGGQWLRVTFGQDGFLLNLAVGGRAMPDLRPNPDPAADRDIAEAALKAWLSDATLTRLGEPEASLTEETGALGARRFLWRFAPGAGAQVEYSVTLDVAGSRVLAQSIVPRFAGNYLAEQIQPRLREQQLAGIIRLLLMAALALYACYRYARRTLEREAPHARAAALTLFLVGFGAALLATDPYQHIAGNRAEDLNSFVFFLIILISLAGYLLQGAVLGISYGSGEGEVRELFPDKLTSLDTLLRRHLGSANLGTAIVGGAACSAWFFLLLEAGLSWAEPNPSGLGIAALPYLYSRTSWLTLIFNIPAIALMGSVLGLLVPLTFLRRHVRPRWLLLLLLGLASVACANLGENPEVSEPSSWCVTIAAAAALLVPFLVLDYLAAVVSLSSLLFVRELGDLSAVSPDWARGAPWVFSFTACMLAAFAWAAWKGRRYRDEEVRPEHARNLAERLAIQAEFDTARQAQMRLLPDTPPDIAGLQLAAVCHPAKSVAGDFYDFFPLPGGRLGLVLAEGGNDGLASALTIALAKGFLLYESLNPMPPVETLLRLESALGAHLSQRTGRTAIGLLLADPSSGSFEIARSGHFPDARVLAAGGAIIPVPFEQASGGALSSARFQLEPGESVILYTDGLPRTLEARGDSLEALLRRAGASESLFSNLGGFMPVPAEEVDDDLTAVAVRFSPASSAALEGAA
jgi:hypothetical protein